MVICKKCSEIDYLSWLLLDCCTLVANILRREELIGRTWFVWRISWGIMMIMRSYWNRV